MKKQEPILYGIIGLLVGILIMGALATTAVNNDNHSMMGMDAERMHYDQADNHGQMSMSDMAGQLKNKTGDEFDKLFIEQMIAHHEGAIQMAQLIPGRAKHEEIKQLGEAVISAQSKEINDMKNWQINWGYPPGETNTMMHGAH